MQGIFNILLPSQLCFVNQLNFSKNIESLNSRIHSLAIKYTLPTQKLTGTRTYRTTQTIHKSLRRQIFIFSTSSETPARDGKTDRVKVQTGLGRHPLRAHLLHYMARMQIYGVCVCVSSSDNRNCPSAVST